MGPCSANPDDMELAMPHAAGGGLPAPRPAPAAFPVIDFDIEAFLGVVQPNERQQVDSLLQAPPAWVPPPAAAALPRESGQTVQLDGLALRKARRILALLPRFSDAALPPGVTRTRAFQALFTYVVAQRRSRLDGDILIHKMARQGNVSELIRYAELMIHFRHGTHVNTKNRHGETPLHVVTCPKAADALLQRGARLDARDSLGNTPLHLAARFQRVDVLQTLLQRMGDDVNLLDQKNLEGYTALHLVVIHQPQQEPHRRALQLLIESRVDVNVADDTGGRSPLFHAVLRGDEPTVRELVEANAAVNMADFSETTPLQAAEDLLPANSSLICSILMERGGFKVPPADRVTQSGGTPRARRAPKRQRLH
ncbi:ankyrin-3-like isoform X1 [Pollicipes pollicipes]|uniref:ankyrin-3-like isoform X1 n=2 Tax=Pollicipes pollicipes TaxID=41117 RepID=UPI001884B3F6|nr:ankyrin-3-like isoform X1 [Pollicipes pollicipes]